MTNRWYTCFSWTPFVALPVAVLLTACPAQTTDPNVPDTAKTITLERVAEAFSAPVVLVAPSDGTGRLFIADQAGLIWVIENGQVVETPMLDLRDQLAAPTSTSDERGLLGLALHPSFASNRRLFVYFNAPPSIEAPIGTATEVRLSEFQINATQPNVIDAGSERNLFRLAKPQNNHNGGQLAFGPDGLLYVGIGDGGGSNDTGFGHTTTLGNAQDTTTLLGKILRIDVDTGTPYGIPASNPFAASTTARPEIYAYGFRNPWRFSFDSGTGGSGQLIVGDVGQSMTEEVDTVKLGGNYGWNIKEGILCLSISNCANVGAGGEALLSPVLTYSHSTGTAIIGGYVYRGAALSALVGQYIFGDYEFAAGASGKIFAAQTGVGTWTFQELRVAGTEDGRLGRAVLSFGRDASGELYILSRSLSDSSGAVDKIVGYE